MMNTSRVPFQQEAMNDDKLGEPSYYRYPKRTSKIIERPDLMGRMTHLLRRDADSTRVIILCGLEGQGKTMLAKDYCRQAERKCLFLAIFWLDASSEDSLLKDLITVSDVINHREDQLFRTSESRIRSVLQRFEEWNRPWLLVMDNYDNPRRLKKITNYMPDSVHGSILVSRRQTNLERLGTIINVPPMSKSESLLMLYDRCGDNVKAGPDDGHATKIVEILGYLPLAIDQAAAYLQRRVGFPLSRFVEEYSERRVSIWSEVPIIRDYNEPVSTTWEMLFQLLDEDESKRDEMGNFLTMLSFLDFRNI